MNDVIYDVTAFLIIVKNFKNPITYNIFFKYILVEINSFQTKSKFYEKY